MMDSDQQKLHSLGYLGIFKESFKILFSWKKIFTQITLSLILPLAIIYLFHTEVSDYLLSKISHDEQSQDAHASDTLRSYTLTYCAIQIAFLVCVLVLSLLCTPVVVYTIACIYTAKEITYKKVMKVVPRVWKRLMVTFLWIVAAEIIYGVIGFVLYIMLMVWSTPIGIVVELILLVLYLAGFTYLTVICNMASVVPVLEENYGIEAIIKSMELIKGKTKAVIGILLTLILVDVGILLVFDLFVMYLWRSHEIRAMVPLAIGIVCLSLLLCLFLLFSYVVKSVIYFVCKSYHCKNMDKLLSAGHLDADPMDYAPLEEAVAKDTQLEQV